VGQSSERDLRRVASLGPYDIVLGDGSHFWKDQILTFQILAAAVRPGGFYILEDLDTSCGANISRLSAAESQRPAICTRSAIGWSGTGKYFTIANSILTWARSGQPLTTWFSNKPLR
jgi:hypothetical protein